MTTTPKKTESGCLICGKSDKKLRKGLCPSHYNAYLASRKLAEARGFDLDAYDLSLIEKGLLAEDARQSGNPFTAALQEFAANQRVAKLEKATKDARKRNE